MINIEDKSHAPSEREMCEYAACALFDELCEHMRREYDAKFCIEYSADRVLLGWNLKFKKAGRTLCTVYPRAGRFFLLLVVGQKEKPRVERLLPGMSGEFRRVYSDTPEGMGQRWMLFDLCERTALYDDLLAVIDIRRHPPKAQEM